MKNILETKVENFGKRFFIVIFLLFTGSMVKPVFLFAQVNPPAEGEFVRGDFDGVQGVNITDAIRILQFLFLTGTPPQCSDAADANDDGKVNLTDAIYTLNFFFLGGRPIPPPNSFPGKDLTPDGLECNGGIDLCLNGEVSPGAFPCACGNQSQIISPNLNEGPIFCCKGKVQSQPCSPFNGFIRGNAFEDTVVDINDVYFIINFLHFGGPAPACMDAADANDDGKVDDEDAAYLLAFLPPNQGPPPLPPFPEAGTDLTPDSLTCGDSADLCPFGRINNGIQCSCNGQYIETISKKNAPPIYCCYDRVQSQPCQLKAYSEAPRSQEDGRPPANDIMACTVDPTTLQGCEPYEKDYQELKITTAAHQQLNPSAYLWSPRGPVLEPGKDDVAFLAWEESINGDKKVYWCDLRKTQTPQDCEKNKILAGVGYNPSLGGTQSRAYLLWEDGQQVVGCDLSLRPDDNYSCYVNSKKANPYYIFYQSPMVNGVMKDGTHQAHLTPLSKYGYALWRDAAIDANQILQYSLQSCHIDSSVQEYDDTKNGLCAGNGAACLLTNPVCLDKSSCVPIHHRDVSFQCPPTVAAEGIINLPHPGDISPDGAMVYAIQKGGGYSIYSTSKATAISENLNLVDSPQVLTLKDSTGKSLNYAVWKISDPGMGVRIFIKLIKEDTLQSRPVKYQVDYRGQYSDVNGQPLFCNDPGNLCIIWDKSIGPLESAGTRSDISNGGNFINELYKCNLLGPRFIIIDSDDYGPLGGLCTSRVLE